MKKRIFMVLTLILWTMLFIGEAQENNIALNKPYTFSAKPNYHLCTDEGDLVQLTDGKYATAWALWSDRGSVGWHSQDFVSINIDLGKVEPINGLSFNTAAGASDVALPEAIHIFVSEDGKSFYQVGDLLKLCDELPEGKGYREYRIKTDKIKTKGRYVRLFIIPGKSSMKYIFVDEIEVYRGPEDYLKTDLGKKIDNFDLFVLKLLPWS